VHEAYKCRVRTPWWRVPLQEPADLLLTYMNADTPRLVANAAGAHHLNSVHGLYLRAEQRELGRALLPYAALNSMTLLGAETVGRAYGGGLLKIEPREADRLPVPSPALVEAARPALEEAEPEVTAALQRGQLLTAVERVDAALLTGALGLAPGEIAALRAGREQLAARRRSRGGRGPVAAP